FFMMEKGIMPRFHLLQINAKGNVMCPENENGRPTPPVFQNEGPIPYLSRPALCWPLSLLIHATLSDIPA
ncbi:hypothetical protein MJM04_28240, partial [Salmonella enterica subsp. enterica serovar Cerro]|nr:hypothetical protein [Salmonella enterica subsp. enterica serovar Cerro]